MPSLPSVTDLKTYLGLTGTADDALLAQVLAAAIGQAEHDTARTFSAASNTATRYSTNLAYSLVIHDRPYTDASRTVTLNGVTLVEGTSVWFLPDRRDQNTTTTVQLRVYGVGNLIRDFYWFDGNHDNPRYMRSGTPNDLVITGIIGQPFPVQDVVSSIEVLAAFRYWRAKAGATGQAYNLAGETISLAETPPEYQDFVKRWRMRTAVDSVG